MKLKPILWTLFVVVLVPFALRGCVAMLVRPAPLLAAKDVESSVATTPTAMDLASSDDTFSFHVGFVRDQESPTTDIVPLNEEPVPVQPRIGTGPNAVLPETADPEFVTPTTDPSGGKSQGNVPATTGLPDRPISAAPAEPPTPQPVVDADIVVYPLIGPKKRVMAPPNGIPDLTGNWAGEGWGQIELRQTESGVFRGSYSDTYGKKPGAIALRWSAEDRRYKGEWTEGDGDRLGELIVRPTSGGNVIRGAFSADAKSKINPSNPKLGDLEWTRVIPGVVVNVPAMGPLPREIPYSYKRPDAGQGPAAPLGNGLRSLSRDRNVVKDEVRREFEARQESLRKELDEFRDRIDRLAVALHHRDRQKDTIIERRVDELLDPNLRWDVSSNTPSGTNEAAKTGVDIRRADKPSATVEPAAQPGQPTTAKRMLPAPQPESDPLPTPGTSGTSNTAKPQTDAPAQAPTTELEGLWELVYPEELGAPPVDQRLRLVCSGNLHATFQGQKLIAFWQMKLDPRQFPKRITLEGDHPMRGIYDLKDDSLRLSLVPPEGEFPTKFGIERPEFQRVAAQAPKDLIDDLRDHDFNRKAGNKL